jgi:hypothetical protein
VALYKQSGVSVESWVEMATWVPMRYETDPATNRATLYFGQDDDYVLTLHRDNLAQLLTLASQAITDLESDR